MESSKEMSSHRTRALLFSNFPSHATNACCEKLARYEIEVIRVVSADQSSGIAIGDAEVVLAMTELMGGLHINSIKDFAKKHQRPYVGLSRKYATWDRDLRPILEKKKAQQAPPPPVSKVRPLHAVPPAPPAVLAPSRPVPPLASAAEPIEEATQLIAMYEQENTGLIAERDALQEEMKTLYGRLSKLEDMGARLQQQQCTLAQAAEQTIEQVTRGHAVEVHNLQSQLQTLQLAQEWAEKAQLTLETTKHEAKNLELKYRKALKDNQDLVKDNQGLNAKLASEGSIIKEQGAAIREQAQELVRLRKPTVVVAPANKAGNDLLKMMASFKPIWRSGMMTSDEILEKLMDWASKEAGR